MKRVFSLVAVVVIIAFVISFASYQQANAGGSFHTLTFPFAGRHSCGWWEASGLRGLTPPGWFAMYSVLDGNGRILANGTISQLPANGAIRGSFSSRPRSNPIHFVAVAYDRGNAYIIGDVYADNPCLPPSHPTPTPIPTRTPMEPTRTPIAPRVEVGCSHTTVQGYIVEPITPFVRVAVMPASDPTVQLTSLVLPINGYSYEGILVYPQQPAGTQLIIAVSEWDGTQAVRPTQFISADCNALLSTPIPTPILVIPTNTAAPSPTTLP